MVCKQDISWVSPLMREPDGKAEKAKGQVSEGTLATFNHFITSLSLTRLPTLILEKQSTPVLFSTNISLLPELIQLAEGQEEIRASFSEAFGQGMVTKGVQQKTSIYIYYSPHYKHQDGEGQKLDLEK